MEVKTNKDSRLPLDDIEVIEDELTFVLGGAAMSGGAGAGCGCGCATGGGCGCECKSGTGCGCGCNCPSGKGCGCGCANSSETNSPD